MMKLIRIIRSKLYGKYTKAEENWVKERREICSKCPLMSKNVNKKKGLRYWFWDILNFNEAFCTLCGCEIAAKTSEEYEECEDGKWKQHLN